ncbi:MAG: RNA polymerase sigma factor [Acidimicrobiia bacterium]
MPSTAALHHRPQPSGRTTSLSPSTSDQHAQARSSIEDVAQLVERARSGDENAWRELHSRFAGLLHNTISRDFHLRGPDGDDVRQLVWLRVVSNIGRLAEPRTFPAWLKMIATRECIRHLNAAARRQLPAGDLFDPRAAIAGPESPVDPADHAVLSVLGQQLRTACANAAEQDRRVLELLLQPAPPSQRELASELGIPAGSVSFHKRRAIAGLQILLGAAESGPAGEPSGVVGRRGRTGRTGRGRQLVSTNPRHRSASSMAPLASSR